MKALLTFLSLLAVAGCGQSGPQAGTGGAVTGPSITVNCQVTASGGGSQGDTHVTTHCPKDSQNTVPAPEAE